MTDTSSEVRRIVFNRRRHVVLDSGSLRVSSVHPALPGDDAGRSSGTSHPRRPALPEPMAPPRQTNSAMGRSRSGRTGSHPVSAFQISGNIGVPVKVVEPVSHRRRRTTSPVVSGGGSNVIAGVRARTARWIRGPTRTPNEAPCTLAGSQCAAAPSADSCRPGSSGSTTKHRSPGRTSRSNTPPREHVPEERPDPPRRERYRNGDARQRTHQRSHLTCPCSMLQLPFPGRG